MTPKLRADHTEVALLTNPAHFAQVKLRLVPGAIYRFAGFRLGGKAGQPGRWRVPPGDYRLIGVGVQVRTWQELVAHVGIGGPDDGKMFFCPLASWADLFTLKEDPPPPEKVAGALSAGRQQMQPGRVVPLSMIL